MPLCCHGHQLLSGYSATQPSHLRHEVPGYMPVQNATGQSVDGEREHDEIFSMHRGACLAPGV